MALTTNEITNSAEFTVEKKVEGAYRWKRIGFWAMYIGIPIVFLVIAGLTGLMALWLIVFVPLYFPFALPKFIYPLTYIYVQIEYEYAVISGALHINYVYGRKKRAEMMPGIPIKDMTLIAPYEGETRAKIDAETFDITYVAPAYKDHPDNYVCVFKNADGKNCMAIFQMPEHFIKLFKFHNKNFVEKTKA